MVNGSAQAMPPRPRLLCSAEKTGTRPQQTTDKHMVWPSANKTLLTQTSPGQDMEHEQEVLSTGPHPPHLRRNVLFNFIPQLQGREGKTLQNWPLISVSQSPWRNLQDTQTASRSQHAHPSSVQLPAININSCLLCAVLFSVFFLHSSCLFHFFS